MRRWHYLSTGRVLITESPFVRYLLRRWHRIRWEYDRQHSGFLKIVIDEEPSQLLKLQFKLWIGMLAGGAPFLEFHGRIANLIDLYGAGIMQAYRDQESQIGGRFCGPTLYEAPR